MNDTPETDMKQRLMYMDALECVEIDFARTLERERNNLKQEVERLKTMTAKAIGWQKQAELDAKLLVECREKAERYRLEANAMMAQRSEAREALKRIIECDMRWSKKIARDALEAAK